MKYFYSLFKPFLTISCIAIAMSVKAQSTTTVSPSGNCSVVQNFNDSVGGFTSPSIYSDQYDYPFSWTGVGSNGMMSGSAPTFNPYETSIISPIYTNQAPDGSVVVGFSYTAPANTLYRIRVIRTNSGTGQVDIVANTSPGPPIGGGSPNWAVLPSTSGNLCLNLAAADLRNGETYRYEFTFYVESNAANVMFDNFALTSVAPAPLPLPVTFMGIVATREKNNVTVRWDVGTEIHVKQYDVEKSSDGRTFNVVGNVAAEQKQVYAFTEPNAGSGILFYRVKSVDLDGSVKYSGIVKLVSSNSYSNSIRIYPSPATSLITIAHDRLSAHAKITVSTMDGRIVKVMNPSSGASNSMIDISNLTSGMYILRLDDGNGKIQTSSFVKQ